jgi:hypothetical protein
MGALQDSRVEYDMTDLYWIHTPPTDKGPWAVVRIPGEDKWVATPPKQIDDEHFTGLQRFDTAESAAAHVLSQHPQS